MITTKIALLLGVTFAIAPYSTAQTISARDFLERARALREKQALDSNPNKLLDQLVEQFGKEWAFKSSAEAGKNWLGLFDLFVSSKSKKAAFNEMNWSNFSSLAAVLPGPDSWPTIAHGLKAKKDYTNDNMRGYLHLLAEVLVGDAASQWKAMSKMIADPKPYEIETLTGLYRSLAISTNDKVRLAKSFDLRLKPAKDGSFIDLGESSYSSDGPYSGNEFPDLVGILGKAQTTVIILQKLKGSKPVAFGNGTDTEKLAKQLYAAKLANFKIAHWELVTSPNDIKLYEAMVKQFGKPKPKPTIESGSIGSDQEAGVFYFLGLLQTGRIKEAIHFSRSLQTAELSYGWRNRTKGQSANERAGLYPGLPKMLADEVKVYPNSVLWSLFLQAAQQQNEVAQFLGAAEVAVKKPGLTRNTRSSVIDLLIDAYLANNQADKAIALMVKLTSADTSSPFQQDYTSKILEVAKLLKKNDIIQKIISSTDSNSASQSVQDYYMETQQYDKLISSLLESYATSKDEMMGRSETPDTLAKLVCVYAKQKRYDDVIYLIDNAPDWDVSDIRETFNTRYRYNFTGEFRCAIAKALAETGRKAEALKFVNAILADSPGDDQAYEILVDLLGDDALAKLDELSRADQFEERPLIWKAVVLFRQKRFVEAEAAARKAISIDPTDGEQPAGRRIYAYAVLADIREALGAAEEAKDLRKVVQAVRLAEQGDSFASAGLNTQAIELFEKSMVLFKDAYCIQFRLAVQLARKGRIKEAAEHYRRAFEVMPDQFGRMESECLGCDELFSGKLDQEVAEKVLSELIAKNPKKPQLYYLTGWLRESQNRVPEAVAAYKKAVALDPDYLSAWIKLASFINGTLSVPDTESVRTALSRLDPMQRHTEYIMQEFDQRTTQPISKYLAKVWLAGKKSAELRTKLDGQEPIYRFEASARKIALDKTKDAEANYRYDAAMAAYGDRTPAAYLVRTSLLSNIVEGIDSASNKNTVR